MADQRQPETSASNAPAAVSPPSESTPDYLKPDPSLLYEAYKDAPANPGIVCTVRGMGTVLSSWIKYHLSLGFGKLYIYLDDPEELELYADHSCDARVVLIPCDSCHRTEIWPGLKLWQKFSRFHVEEVQARQELNCEHAVQLALQDKVGWLLHIDADELFHCPGETAQEHFAQLQAAGVAVCNYVNHEGVPETPHVHDFFREVTLFRRSVAALPEAGAGGEVCGSVRAALRFWQQRSPHGQYFLGYENGKSAVAVVAGALPLSVHEWLPPTLALFRRGRHNIRGLDTGGALQYHDHPACVLHYISCGEEWWRRKYELLGPFGDAWFGGAVPIPPSFHLHSRDLARPEADPADAQAFYRAAVVMEDPAQIEEQIAAGVLQRILLPQRILLAQEAPQSP